MNSEDKEEEFSPAESLQLITKMLKSAKEDKLRKIAKKRVGFKKALAITAFITLMLIVIWYFTTGPQSYFWPMWPFIGFAFSLLIQYLEAYSGTTFFSEEKEYEKLTSQQKTNSINNNNSNV